MAPWIRALAFSVALGLGATACGSSAPELQLSPAGEEGHEVARQKGCAACHGSSGQGGVGPDFTGLAGSTVELADGTTVVADEDYLRRAIVDPNAEMVDGYQVSMPATNLSDAEVDALIAYITELAGDGTSDGTDDGGSAP